LLLGSVAVHAKKLLGPQLAASPVIDDLFRWPSPSPANHQPTHAKPENRTHPVLRRQRAEIRAPMHGVHQRANICCIVRNDKYNVLLLQGNASVYRFYSDGGGLL
jgi:hypothetical protein